MRLAVAFDLRDFVERLPAHAILGVFAVDLLAGERLDDREHDAVAQIAVMGESEHVAAGFLFEGRHPFPQVARIVTAERFLRGVRFDLAGPEPVLPEDDIAMKVVSAGVRSPLIADESGEAAWVIRLVRGFNGFLPRPAIGWRARQREILSAIGPCRKLGDDVDRRLRTLAGGDHGHTICALAASQAVSGHRSLIGEKSQTHQSDRVTTMKSRGRDSFAR